MATAQTVLGDLLRRGFVLIAAGDKLRIAPRGAVTDEIRQIIRAHRQEILAILRQHGSEAAEAPPSAYDPWCPWPPALPGWGDKTLGPLTRCLVCQGATWVRFGFVPLCLACARKAPAPLDPETRLSSFLTTWFTLDEKAWSQGDVDAIKNIVMDIFRDHSEAESWFREWRAAHPEARLS